VLVRPAIAAAGVLLGLLAACSGDNDPGLQPGEAGAMSPEALEGVAFADGERVAGGTAELDEFAELAEDHAADRAECQPLASLVGVEPRPATRVHREVDGEGFSDPGTAVLLLSYDDDGAAEVMAALEAAGTACAGGFVERRLEDITVASVEPVEAPALGDQALAFRIVTLTNDAEPEERPTYFTVIRAGHELLSFETSTLDLSDAGSVPAGVIEAQWEKYAAARG
jgi:hypothetical protein